MLSIYVIDHSNNGEQLYAVNYKYQEALRQRALAEAVNDLL
jgi:hypothetical protein